MLLRALTLQNFRNIAEARLEFSGARQFFLGANGQGKTNVLEAAGCLSALRSFRTTDSRAMIRHGAAEAAVVGEVDQERRGAVRLALAFRPGGKALWWDQERVGRLADHLGQFPTVAFSAQDLLLVRGAPSVRRRWLDLTLAAIDGAYLRSLLGYTRALAERNRLLKLGRGEPAEFSAFERVLAEHAVDLRSRRVAGLPALARSLADAYGRLGGGREAAALVYAPSPEIASVDGWREVWERSRPVDQRIGQTLQGPHRDELEFTVQGVAAKEYASEGQQRSFVLALRLAQAAWFQERSGIRPVVLADDVLGELDPVRRRQFWAALDPAAQVIATGTGAPDPELGDWQIFQVADGTFAQ
jgi:DNA replication and repair protein RecF